MIRIKTGFRQRLLSISIGFCVALLTPLYAGAELDKAQALKLGPYPQPSAADDSILIRNATLWTLEADGILTKTDLLIKAGPDRRNRA